MTYAFLQHYWFFIVALLAALLVFLMFVQGANSLLFSLGRTADERRLLVNSTGRKWEFTFTTLVTFGGAFFASYPLFYSTSFGGAYWLWMIILFSFVLQAVSYEFQHKLGNLLGAKTFQWMLVLNGILGPLLLGATVGTFFTGSNFILEECTDGAGLLVSSRWANASHGLDALLNLTNLLLGLAVFFLARILGCLYLHKQVDETAFDNHDRFIQPLWRSTWLFLGTFLTFLYRVLTGTGYAYDPATGEVFTEPYKYLHNLLEMWPLSAMLLVGVVFVLFGIGWSVANKAYKRGFWVVGFGTVVTVLVLLLITAWNNTAYYPSTADLQSSLTIRNSSGSEFTLRTMFYVSLLIPFVLAYIVYAWHAIDKKVLTPDEITDEHAY